MPVPPNPCQPEEVRHMQRTPDPEIKAATRRLITACGGIDAAASAVGLGRSTMAEYQAAHLVSHMPLDVVCVLEQFSGTVEITALLARRHGLALVPAESSPAACLTRQVSRLFQEAAELGGAHADALTDGIIDATERERIGREASDVIRVASEILGTCKS